MKPSVIFFLAVVLLSCRTNNPGVLPEPPAVDEIDTDTAVLEDNEPVLKGTTVLTGSDKNRTSQWIYGLYLMDIRSSPCRGSGEKVPPTEITSVTHPDDSTLVVTANVFANCASSFLGEIEVVNDSTINLVAQEYGGFAACSCCFGLTYTIELSRADEEIDFSKYKYVTIEGLDKTKLPPLR